MKKGTYVCSDSESDAHHEEDFLLKNIFREQTYNLTPVFNELRNPFPCSNELFRLNTRNIVG